MKVAQLGLLLAVGGVVAAVWAGLAVTRAAGSVVSLDASDRNIKIDETVTLEIYATELSNLAAYEVKIEYDSDVIEFVEFQNTGWLASTGRQVTCPPPSPLDDNTSDSTKAILVGCGSFNLSPDGPSGDAQLAAVTFRGAGAGTSDVLFRKVELAVPGGDSCCTLTGVDDTSIKVSSDGNDSDAPPKPRADMTRLTPTPPPGAVSDETYRIDPSLPVSDGNTSTQDGSSREGRSGTVARANAGPNVSANGSAAGSDGFPVAGHGPQSSGDPGFDFGWVVIAAVAGLILVGAGAMRQKQSRR